MVYKIDHKWHQWDLNWLSYIQSNKCKLFFVPPCSIVWTFFDTSYPKNLIIAILPDFREPFCQVSYWSEIWQFKESSQLVFLSFFFFFSSFSFDDMSCTESDQVVIISPLHLYISIQFRKPYTLWILSIFCVVQYIPLWSNKPN